MYNVTHDDYSFTERTGQEQWVVRLKTGEWADTYYTYGKISISESEDNEEATLHFNYTILESDNDKEKLATDAGFNNYIGAVLHHILEDSLDKGEYRLGHGDESTDNNTKKPN